MTQQTAADLAKSIAEFETPKLARIESSVEEVKTDCLMKNLTPELRNL